MRNPGVWSGDGMFPSAAYVRTLATKCCHNDSMISGEWSPSRHWLPSMTQRGTGGLQQGVNPEMHVWRGDVTRVLPGFTTNYTIPVKPLLRRLSKRASP